MNRDIAIIGVAGRFPDAKNIDELFLNLKEGRDSLRAISLERVRATTLPAASEYRVAGYLEDIDKFDHAYFNIPLGEAETMDPHQRLLLEVVQETLDNAGYPAASLFGSSTAVYVADASLDYYQHADAFVPTLKTGNVKAFLSARIARQFNLTGNAAVVDTSCSSSLVAVHLACNDLILGDADYALACAANLDLFPFRDGEPGLDLDSPDGKARPFSAQANGMSFGEGVACVLLKPLDKALVDGDIVHAVIKGTAVNNNAGRSASLTAPDSKTQAEVICKAWQKAGIHPENLGFIEVHGSGTQLGDSIEIGGLDAAFRVFTSKTSVCPISTIKSNIGHTRGAAGIASLIKAVLALKHATLFPAINFESPSPLINFEHSAVRINQYLTDWVSETTRLAGVSSIGLSGVNCHLVLAEKEQAIPFSRPDLAWHLINVTGLSPSALKNNVGALRDWLSQNPQVYLPDVAFTLNRGRAHHRYRASFLCQSTSELADQLQRFSRQETETGRLGGLIFMFSDHVDLSPSLTNTLRSRYPDFEKSYRQCEAAVSTLDDSQQTFAFKYSFYQLLGQHGITTPNLLGLGSGKILVDLISGEISLSQALQRVSQHLPQPLTDVDKRVEALVARETAHGQVTFLEIGPESAISVALARQITPTSAHRVYHLVDGSSDPLLNLVQQLYLGGYDVNWEPFYRDIDVNRIELPAYQFDKIRCWLRDAPKETTLTTGKIGLPLLQEDASLLETQLAALWQEVLGVDQLSLDDDFFMIGGKSLQATKVINRINERHQLTLAFEDLFDFPTLRRLASYIDQLRGVAPKLADYWREVLKTDHLSAESDFFSLGGHSLLANQILIRIRKEFGVSLNFDDFFVCPTLGEMAILVGSRLTVNSEFPSGEAPVDIPTVTLQDTYEISSAQKRLWILSQMEDGLVGYNQPGAYLLQGRLDADALSRAFATVVERHESLRTSFVTVDGEPRQKIHPFGGLDLPVIDLQHQPNRWEVARAMSVEDAAMPFDLERGPLFRVGLVRLEAEEYVLLFSTHHIISDGWSMNVLVNELFTLYKVYKAGGQNPLKPLLIQYKDYAAWHNLQMEEVNVRSHRAYWSEKFAANRAPLNLPLDYPRPVLQTFEGKCLSFALEESQTHRLTSLCRQEGASLFMGLLATLNGLFYRYTGQHDLTIGTPVAGREHPSLEKQIGFYANTLALRTKFETRASFTDLLRQVKDTTLEAYKHQVYPFERLIEDLALARDPARAPLLDVMMVLHNERSEAQLDEINIGEFTLEGEHCPFDLVFHFSEKQGIIQVNFLYNVRLFSAETASRMKAHYLALVAEALNGPAIPLGEIQLGEARHSEWGNDQVFVLDDQGRQVELGIAGKIYLNTTLFPKGHLAGLTSFSDKQVVDGLLNTGDTGRWLAGGKLEVLNASPYGYFIDGDYLFTAGIEYALGRVSHVADVKVLNGSVRPDQLRLAAYLVADRILVPAQVKRELAGILPSGVLAALVLNQVDALPLNVDGDVDVAVLTALPWVDSDVLASALEQQPGVQDLAVLVEQTAPVSPVLHVWDVLGKDHYARVIKPEKLALLPARGDNQQNEAYARGGDLSIPLTEPWTLTESLIRTAREFPDKGVFIRTGESATDFISYPELLHRARVALTGLRQHHLHPGDSVILQLENLADYLTVFWGCILGGIHPVTVAVAPLISPENSLIQKLKGIWQLLGQPPIVVGADIYDDIRALAPDFETTSLEVITAGMLAHHESATDLHPSRLTDTAFYQLSSGSTGIPKCIIETHSTIIHHIHACRLNNDLNSDDITLNWLPFDHVAPIITFHLRDIYLGVNQVQLYTLHVLSNPLVWLASLDQYRVTYSWSPNFGYKLATEALLKAKDARYDLSSLRYLLNGGEQVTLAVVEEFERLTRPFGLRPKVMQPGYGMAEVCTTFTYNNDFDFETYPYIFDKESLRGEIQFAGPETLSSITFINCGRPIPGSEVRIADEINNIVTERRVGRIQLRSASVFPGYLHNERANQEVFVGDGWYNTGDLGFLLDGNLFITGREKEMIIIRGVHYYCYEIEDLVGSLEGVTPTFVGICSVSDPQSDTEGVAVFFSPTEIDFGMQLNVINQIKTQIASRFGIAPLWIIPVTKETFPKTTSGKIQRMALRQGLVEGRFDDVIKQIDLANAAPGQTIPNWFYEPVWKRRNLGRPAETGGTILLLSSGENLTAGVREMLAERRVIAVSLGPDFRRENADQYHLDCRRSDQFSVLAKCLAGENVTDIVHTWSLDDGGLVATFDRTLFSLLYTLQGVATWSIPATRLWVLTQNARNVTGQEAVNPDHGVLPGFLKSVRQEMDWITPVLIDLAGVPLGRLPQVLRDELSHRVVDQEVAYRGATRYVARLHRLDCDIEVPSPIPLKPGGFYLVTGGLGAIGHQVARYLLDRFNAKLLLIGRTHLDSADELAGDRHQSLLRLKRAGTHIEYRPVDVADRESLNCAVQEMELAWGQPIDGVLHLAGELEKINRHWEHLEDKMLLHTRRGDFDGVFQAKVYGTRVLADLVKARPGSVFIAFSSVNSYFGGYSFGPYAAASGYLDATTIDLNRYGVRAQTINWSLWDNVGMNQDNAYKHLSTSKGFVAMLTEQALNSLSIALRSGKPQVLVGLDGTNAHIRQYADNLPVPVPALQVFYVRQDTSEPDERAMLQTIRSVAGRQVRGYLREVEAIPRLSDGTVDGVQLLSVITGRITQQVAATTSPEEALLEKVWKDVLGRSGLSIFDNFFELGGDSIKAIQVISRVYADGFKLVLKDIFKYPTVSQLAPHLKKSVSLADQSEVTGTVPLTPIQREFFAQPRSEPHHYNMSVMLSARDGFDAEALRAVFARMQEHHDALRMVFRLEDGRIVQQHGAVSPSVNLEVADLRHADDPYLVLEQHANALQVGINLAEGPPMKLGVYRMPDGDRLLIVLHHLVVDGVSWRIIFEDLGNLYQQYSNGEPLNLPLKTDSFKQWSEKLGVYANSNRFLQEKAYWSQLEQTTVPAIPKDALGASNFVKDFTSISFNLNEDLTELLITKVNSAYNTEINDILLTALSLAFRNAMGLQRLLLLLEAHGREDLLEDVNISRTIGWFTSTYPVILDASQDDLSRHIKEAKEQLHQVPNRGVGYGILRYLSRDEFKDDVAFGLNPEVSFNYLGQFGSDVENSTFTVADETVGQEWSHSDQRSQPINVFGLVAQKELVMSVSYNTTLFEAATMEQLIHAYKAALVQIITHCAGREDSELTPSDFSFKKLSIDELDAIFS